MVHLIYKLYINAVVLCVKFNGAFGFSEKCLFLAIPKLVPDDPKTGA